MPTESRCIKVQRGVEVFGASADVLAVNLGAAVSSLTKAFVRITSVGFNSQGADAGDGSDRTQRDLSCTVKFNSTSQIEFERPAAATDFDVRVCWEVWEYIGPAGGPHEFIVRLSSNVTFAGGSGTQDSGNFSFTTLADLVPIIGGYRHASAAEVASQAAYDAVVVDNGNGTAKITYTRAGTTATCVLSQQVVEFTGSAWSVQAVAFSFSSTGTTSFSCSAVVWAQTFMIVYCTTGANVNRDATALFWPGADTTHFRGNIPASSTTTTRGGTAYLISNPKLEVDHDDSIGGSITPYSATGSVPQNFSLTFTATLGTTVTTADIGSVGFSDNDGSGTTYGSPYWAYNVTDTSHIEFERSRGAGGGNLAFEVLNFADMVTTHESASVTITVGLTTDVVPKLVELLGLTVAPTAHAIARVYELLGLTLGLTAAARALASAEQGITVTPAAIASPHPTAEQGITVAPDVVTVGVFAHGLKQIDVLFDIAADVTIATALGITITPAAYLSVHPPVATLTITMVLDATFQILATPPGGGGVGPMLRARALLKDLLDLDDEFPTSFIPKS